MGLIKHFVVNGVNAQNASVIYFQTLHSN